MAALWPDTIVEEANLAFQISALRKVLEDGGDGDSLIQTVPTRGYRFVGIVIAVGQVAPVVSPPAPRRWSRSPWMWVGMHNRCGPRRARRDRPLPEVGSQTGGGLRLNPQQIQIRRLTDNDEVSDVAISPDGRYVIFVRGDGQNQGLWLRQIDTRTDVEILHADGTDFHGLTFSPDGSLIYFLKSHRDDPFTRSLNAMSILGGAPRTLIDDDRRAHQLRARTGSSSCTRLQSHRLQIRIARVDADNERQLAVIRDVECTIFQPGPRWSPDGLTVVVPAVLRTEPDAGSWPACRLRMARCGSSSRVRTVSAGRRGSPAARRCLCRTRKKTSVKISSGPWHSREERPAA